MIPRELRDAVDAAKRLLKAQGRECSTTPAELTAWFEAETPYDDVSLEEVLKNPYLVVHELVEIEEVRRKGLVIGKRTIVDNLEKVDEAHLVATRLELECAYAQGDSGHIRSRIPDIVAWLDDPSVSQSQKDEYSRLLVEAEKMAEALGIGDQIQG